MTTVNGLIKDLVANKVLDTYDGKTFELLINNPCGAEPDKVRTVIGKVAHVREMDRNDVVAVEAALRCRNECNGSIPSRLPELTAAVKKSWDLILEAKRDKIAKKRRRTKRSATIINDVFSGAGAHKEVEKGGAGYTRRAGRIRRGFISAGAKARKAIHELGLIA